MTFLVSVDGREAPMKEHQTLEEAKVEAVRLSELSTSRRATIRVLEQVCVLVPRTSHEWLGNEPGEPE